MPKDPFDTPAISTSAAEAAMDKASAALDRVLANPKATRSQISNAMTKLNTATDRYASALLNSIGSSTTSQVIQAPTPNTVQDTVVESIVSYAPNLTATPPVPQTVTPTVSLPEPIKSSTPDIILFNDDEVPIEVMSDLIFENIGGQELISIVRSDIVNGQKISYQPIKNLSSIQQQYNPNNILGLQQTANRFFAGFSIKLEDKLPEIGNGLNGENIYFDENTGDLIIEFINLNSDEQIETQITVNGTIYEANLGDYTS